MTRYAGIGSIPPALPLPPPPPFPAAVPFTLALNVNPATVVAWLGPCIGPAAFEVGDDVRTAFVTHDVRAAMHFKPRAAAGKYLCDLYALARQRLAAVGVGEVTGGAYCTYSQPDLFFSHRRHSATGRMAAFVWIDRR